MASLATMLSEPLETVIIKPKKRNRKTRKNKLVTGIKGQGTYLKNWSKQQPGYHDRTVMLRRCGTRCFLGPNKSFPICSRNTCKRNKKGIYAAYIRSEEYKTLRNQDKYRRISAKARRMLHKRKFLHY